MDDSQMATAGPSDVFEHRYAAPLLEPAPVDGLLREREARQGQARAAPGEPFALQGCVVTPDQAVEPGCVVVAGDTIAV